MKKRWYLRRYADVLQIIKAMFGAVLAKYNIL